jgi:nucleotide-binding universal stress UspA family protein
MTYYKWQRILVPTDLSPAAKAGVEYAHALAERFGAELHVLHVVKTMDDLAKEHGVAGVMEPGTDDEFEKWLATLLGETGTVRRVEAVRLGPDPVQTIARYALDEDIDLIVTATRGRSALSHLILSSVSEQLLRVSPCPVLVIRP